MNDNTRFAKGVFITLGALLVGALPVCLAANSWAIKVQEKEEKKEQGR